MTRFFYTLLKGRGLAVVLALLFTGQMAVSQDLPDDFWKVSIEVKSDDNLNSSRLICAAGGMPNVVRRVKAQGVATQIVPKDYCPAVLAEVIRRNIQTYLYGRLQPSNPSEEFNRIIKAAIANQTEYVNVEGVSKYLKCTLAYDVGRVYESYNANDLAVPDWSESKLATIKEACFAENSSTASVNGLIAGVLDQRGS